jgi:hypothetical protein
MAKAKKKATRTTKSTEKQQVTDAPVKTKTRRIEEKPSGNNSPVKIAVVVVVVLLGLFLLLNVITSGNDERNNDLANEGGETSQVEEGETGNETERESDAETTEGDFGSTTVTETDTEYNYTVGFGESYTTVARQAIASMDSELNPAERVAAETKIVSDAGAEWLNAGQSLVLSKETVRSAVDWAKSLSDDEKAAWQPYANLVAW